MNTYKITNITNLAGKRDFKFNSELEIEYIDNMVKKSIKVKPKETVYLSVSKLPLSVHRLRVRGLVTVGEVSEKELTEVLAKLKKPEQKEKSEPKKQTIAQKEVTKKTNNSKKKTSNKSKQDVDFTDDDERN